MYYPRMYLSYLCKWIFENIKLRFYTFTFINFPFALYKCAPPRELRSVSRGGAFIGRVDALERYAVFEDGDFAEAHLFAFCLFAARYAEDEGEEALRGFRYRLAVGDGAGVEVYPARFFAASWLLLAIFIVGAGAPKGVPRPVVKRIMCAPAAVIAVAETRSLPGP